jgi:divalent metal cation (Fe/Co/Zn/Cd) transporter
VSAPVLDDTRRGLLNRRAKLLAWVTIGYNTAEGVVAVLAGLAAGSVALISFGLDSAVEVASATALAWQFGGRGDPRVRERTTLRLIAVAFFALAAWVSIDATRRLFGSEEADTSLVGIVLTAASLVVMPALTWAKRRVGRQLGSATVVADSTQTMLCTYLSAIVLAGLLLNATLGWSWADPIAALVVAGIAVKEGVEAWRGDACCAVPPALTDAALHTGDHRTGDDKADEGCGCDPGCACCTPADQPRTETHR